MSLYDILSQNQANFDNVLQLQDILFNSNEFSIDEIKPVLPNFTQSRKDLLPLLLTLNELGFARSTPIDKFAELFSLISANIRQFFSSDELMAIFSKAIKLYIPLYKCGCINIQSIIEKAQTSEGIFKMFFSVIKASDPIFFNLKLQNASHSLKTFISNRDQAKQETVHAIQKDDCTHIQKVISQTNIGHNSKIPLASTECNDDIKFGWQMPTMLEYAAMQGSVDTFKYLLLNKAELTPKLSNYAILGGNLDIIHILEGCEGFTFNESDLTIAVRFHRHDIAEYLVDAYHMSDSLHTVFEALNQYNLRYFFAHIDLFRNESGDNPVNINWIEMNNTRLTLLQLAAKNGYYSLVELLLPIDQININLRSGVQGYSALLYASSSGLVDIVELLLEKGADINLLSFRNETALHVASSHGHFEVVKFLIEHDDNLLNKIDTDGNTALHLAVQNGRFKIAEFLLSISGIEVNTVNKKHESPLMLAVSENRMRIVTLLCQNPNVDINLMNNEYSPLHMAVIKNALPVVKEMIVLGNNRLEINPKDRYGQTPLLRALKLKFMDIALFLLDQQKIDVNVKNNDNRTVLSYASEMGYLDIVKRILLNRTDTQSSPIEVNINDTDFFGQTALHLAAKNGHFDIMKLLLDAGIDKDIQNSVLHFIFLIHRMFYYIISNKISNLFF